jgi:hypothetical protein
MVQSVLQTDPLLKEIRVHIEHVKLKRDFRDFRGYILDHRNDYLWKPAPWNFRMFLLNYQRAFHYFR